MISMLRDSDIVDVEAPLSIIVVSGTPSAHFSGL